jgi:hypothetical protein
VLKVLSKWLRSRGLLKEADEVEDLDEWAQQYEEYGSEPESEEEYEKTLLEQTQHVPSEKEYVGSWKRQIGQAETTKVFYDVMKNIQFSPVSAGGATPYVGGGEFGKVFRGVYKSRPAVVKIIIKEWDPSTSWGLNTSDKEADNWMKILEYKSSLESELQKHIPEIIDIRRGRIKGPPEKITEKERIFGNLDDETFEKPMEPTILNYEAIIMEELRQIPEEILSIFMGAMGRSSLEFVLRPEILNEVSSFSAVKIVEWLKYQYRIPLDVNAVSGLIFKEIFKNKDKIYNYDQSKQDEGREALVDIISNALFNTLLGKEEQEKVGDISILRRRIKYSLDWSLGNVHEMFPHDWKDMMEEHKEYWENIPEIKKYLETLTTLAKNIGLGWWDIHSKNVMIDRDGNLKVIDVGMYKSIDPDILGI